MAMTPGETIRNRRDREFQKRTLSALEKPKGGRALTLINSPIFLWIISALFLYLGGAYFSAYNQCHGRAEQIIVGYEKILAAIAQRERDIARAAMSAATPQDFRTKIESVRLAASDIHALPIMSLARRAARLMRQMDLSAATDDPNIDSQFLTAYIGSESARDFDGNELEGESFEEFKERHAKWIARGPSAPFELFLEPSCSRMSALRAMLGMMPPVVEVSPISGD